MHHLIQLNFCSEKKNFYMFTKWLRQIMHIKKVFWNFEVSICSLSEIVRSFVNATVFLRIQKSKKYIDILSINATVFLQSHFGIRQKLLTRICIGAAGHEHWTGELPETLRDSKNHPPAVKKKKGWVDHAYTWE